MEDLTPRIEKIKKLTARQAEVLGLIAEGCGESDIAARLRITVRTVKDHKEAIWSRFRIDHMSEGPRRMEMALFVRAYQRLSPDELALIGDPLWKASRDRDAGVSDAVAVTAAADGLQAKPVAVAGGHDQNASWLSRALRRRSVHTALFLTAMASCVAALEFLTGSSGVQTVSAGEPIDYSGLTMNVLTEITDSACSAEGFSLTLVFKNGAQQVLIRDWDRAVIRLSDDLGHEHGLAGSNGVCNGKVGPRFSAALPGQTARTDLHFAGPIHVSASKLTLTVQGKTLVLRNPTAAAIFIIPVRAS